MKLGEQRAQSKVSKSFALTLEQIRFLESHQNTSEFLRSIIDLAMQPPPSTDKHVLVVVREIEELRKMHDAARARFSETKGREGLDMGKYEGALNEIESHLLGIQKIIREVKKD
jgi:hypothetical protein